MTIDELVKKIKPDYVSVNNPKVQGEPTKGNAKVSSAHIDFDKADGIMLYVTIE